MGDRANIVLRDKHYGTDLTADVFLYTHWSGYKVEQIAADGLREAIAAGRVDDVAYGGRIVTDVFLKAHADSPHLGAGVSAIIGDGDSHQVIIDFAAQTVTYQVLTDPEDDSREYGGGTMTEVPIADFLAAFPAEVPAKV